MKSSESFRRKASSAADRNVSLNLVWHGGDRAGVGVLDGLREFDGVRVILVDGSVAVNDLLGGGNPRVKVVRARCMSMFPGKGLRLA
jgi:hypothetical protein